MKIIQLIYSLCSGGAERFVVNLSNELAAMGHDVTLCMLLSSDESKYVFNRQFLSEDVKFVSLGFGQGFSWSKVRRVENFIGNVCPDIVHCHLNVIPYIFRLAVTCPDIRFVHTLHSVAECASGYRMQKAINKWFYRHEKVLPVTISQKCYESYESYYGLNNAHCVLNGCPTPVKTDLFQEVTREVDSFKKDTNTPVFIHVARFHPYKNQKLLIESFNKLDSMGVDFVLLVVGDGYESEGRLMVDMACNQIHFLGLKKNVTDYLLCSDAFCLTSFNEGLPISLLEALSCGVVPICTRAGGIPDVIEEGVSGLLAKDFDVNSYTDKLVDFVNKPDIINKTILRRSFEQQYSMKVCAEKYISIYKGGN